MKKLLLIITLFFSLISFVNAGDFVEINKKRTLLLNYSGKENLKDGDVKIYTTGNKGVRITHSKISKSIYLDIFGNDYEETGVIYVKIGSEIKGIDYKIDLSNKKEYFDISKKVFIKRIQKRPLSCESSATADIVSYFLPENVDEYQIFNKLRKDMPMVAKNFGSNKYWGNPNVGFVGNVDYYGENKDIKPTQGGYTGYGVYEKPIADVYTKYGIETKIINKKDHKLSFDEKDHLRHLLGKLREGNMIQLWGDWCTSPEYEDGVVDYSVFSEEDALNGKSAMNYCSSFYKNRTLTWFYKDNGKLKVHRGLAGEHAFYLLGYEGNIASPEKIIVWDTATGYHKYDIKEWMRKWKMMDYRSIIVYKPEEKVVSRNDKLKNYLKQRK